MKLLSEQVNLTINPNNLPERAIKLGPNCNHYETLTLYCANNDIDVSEYDETDFNCIDEIMGDFNSEEDNPDAPVFFWID